MYPGGHVARVCSNDSCGRSESFFFAIGVIVFSGLMVISFFLSPVLLHEAAVDEFYADGGRDLCRVCVSTQLLSLH